MIVIGVSYINSIDHVARVETSRVRGELLLIARYRRLHDGFGYYILRRFTTGSPIDGTHCYIVLLLITIDGVSLEPEAARRRTSVRYYLDVTVCGGGCGELACGCRCPPVSHTKSIN